MSTPSVARKIGPFVAFAVLTMFYGALIWDANQRHPTGGIDRRFRPSAVAQVVAPDEKPDEKIAKYTLWLAIFTLALVVVSALQIRFLIRADNTARQAANAAALTATAAKNAIDKYVNAERPYLFISEIVPSIKEPEQAGGKPMLGSSASVRCVVKNFGRTPAIDIRLGTALCLSKQPKFSLATFHGKMLIMEKDSTHELLVTMLDHISADIADALSEDKESVSIFLHFDFDYKDIFGTPHKTSGRWTYTCFLDGFVAGDYYRDAT